MKRNIDFDNLCWTTQLLQANVDALEDIRVKLCLPEMSPVTRQELFELRELLTRLPSYVGMLQTDVDQLKEQTSKKRKLRFWR